MTGEKRNIQLGYYFVSEEDFVAMGREIQRRFQVQPLNMPGSVSTMVFAAGFIEIALGAIVAGDGTLALKKVIELITEDLYNCAKDFAKKYIQHRKAIIFGSPTRQLQLIFELDFSTVQMKNDQS